ncbi:MAG: hypothetical protein AABZ60_17265 [Planctomycetota bacterium]
MSEFQEPVSPEQFITTQVRQITVLSLSERSGEALKLALELVEQYHNYPLVHRCIAKVYQRMEQIEVATRHHDIADRLSEEFFRDSNPLIAPQEGTSTPLKNTTASQEKQHSLPPKPEKQKAKKNTSAKPSFNEKELLALRQQLIENTQEDVFKVSNCEIEPIPIVKLNVQSTSVADPQKQIELTSVLEPSSKKQEIPLPVKAVSNSHQESVDPLLLKSITISLPSPLPLKYAMSVFREMYASQIYQLCNQNIEHASQLLGISPENLTFLLGL